MPDGMTCSKGAFFGLDDKISSPVPTPLRGILSKRDFAVGAAEFIRKLIHRVQDETGIYIIHFEEVDPLSAIDEGPHMERRYQVYLKSTDLQKAVGLYPEAIWSSLNILNEIRKKDKIPLLDMAAQSGKTAPICLSALLFQMDQLLNHPLDAQIYAAMLNPATLGSRGQNSDDFCSLRAMMAILQCKSSSGALISVSEATYEALDDASSLTHKNNCAINRDRFKEVTTRISNGDLCVNGRNYVAIMLFVDEEDEAQGENSYIMRLYDDAKEKEIPIEAVGCSATIFGSENLQAFTIIRGPAGPNYSGLCSPVRWAATDITTVADATGVPDFANYHSFKDNMSTKCRILRDVVVSLFNGVDTTTPVRHELYDGVKYTTEWTIAGNVGFNGRPANGGNVIVVRMSNKSTISEIFLRDYQNHLAGLGITAVTCKAGSDIHYKIMGQGRGAIHHKSVSTFEDLLEKLSSIGATNILLLVVAKARRADRFRKECSIFIDLAEDSSGKTSLIQGFCGRACGYDKVTTECMTMVIMTKKVNRYVTEMRYAHDTGTEARQPPGGYAQSTGMPRYLYNIRLCLNDVKIISAVKPETLNDLMRFRDAIMSEVIINDRLRMASIGNSRMPPNEWISDVREGVRRDPRCHLPDM